MFTVFTKATRLMPANQFQVIAEKIICNDVFLPEEIEHSYNPNNIKMWIIGGTYGYNLKGAACCIFASCEQEALEASCDANMLDWCLSEGQDYEDTEMTPLGNSGELFDLSDIWIAEVDFKIERDIKLILKLARAHERGHDTLDFTSGT